jgi:hypothetical protein
LIKIKDDVDLEVTGEGAKPDGDIGFEWIDSDPDCEVL